MQGLPRRTKIVATLGPASRPPETIRELIAAGVDVFRLNFSHGTRAEHVEAIGRVREASAESGKSVAVLQDLQGPKMRIGALADSEPIELNAGASLTIVTKPEIGTRDRVSTTYEPLPRDVRPDDDILLDDGRIQLKVVEVKGDDVLTEVIVGGMLSEHKGMNLPHTALSAPCLTEKDRLDLRAGVEAGVDYVALSFVRCAEDIETLRKEAPSVPVIAKIERVEAIRNLEEIVRAADGVMVARGDLGVETSSAEVPLLQKKILALAGGMARPDITATEMLQSMISNPRPTRAEATDVANAIFDGTDALMLSGETAIGKYPVEAVRVMARIAATAEPHLKEYGRAGGKAEARVGSGVDRATAHAACLAARELGARGIAVFTRSGRTAFLVSANRPDAPIVAFTPHETTYRRLALAWGVTPKLMSYVASPEAFAAATDRSVRESGIAAEGDLVAIVTGTTDLAGVTNTMRILKV